MVPLFEGLVDLDERLVGLGRSVHHRLNKSITSEQKGDERSDRLSRCAEQLGRRQGPPSFREMLEALLMAEALPGHLYERLLSVSRHRNLVFHGEVQEIDRELLNELEMARAEIARLRDAA